MRPDSNLWVTNGQVQTIIRNGNQLYVGGTFTHVGPNTPYGSALDIQTGEPDLKFARPNARVNGAISDGQGGWYIYGGFSDVGGKTRFGLARINADGSLHPWSASVSGNIEAVAFSGGKLYVGYYGYIGLNEQPKGVITALDPVTGVPSFRKIANGRIYSLAIGGGKIFAGGTFDSIDGMSRHRIAALDAVTGSISPWNPSVNGTIRAIVVSENTVYVGGTFTSAGGKNRNNIAALDASTGTATNWNPDANKPVRTLAVSAGVVYAGGYFSTIGGQSRSRIAALDVVSGLPTPWNPNATGGKNHTILQPNFNAGETSINDIEVYGNTVYVCGFFTSIGGQSRNNLAALDPATGKASMWNPPVQAYFGPIMFLPEDVLLGLSPNNNKVYISGEFSSVGGRFRNNLAALDAGTGQATDWNPDVRSAHGKYHTAVQDVKLENGTIYIAGDFDSVGNLGRRNIAAIEATTGKPTAWNPESNSSVLDILISEGKVYAGGSFDSIGGQSRKHLAALNTTNGKATSWNPKANDLVKTLAYNNNTVYVGGEFDSIGGQSRGGIAAIDASTGQVKAWDPKPSLGTGSPARSIINDIKVSGSKIYVGGFFKHIGTQPRSNIAALDATTGKATSWDPNAHDVVMAILVNNNTVYAAGWFDTIGGKASGPIAALDVKTGLAFDWQSYLSYPVYKRQTIVGAMAVGGGKLYTGGLFNRGISNSGYWGPIFGIAAFSGVPTIVGTLSESNPMKVYPNPTSGRIRIDYLLPDPDTKLSLEIFDGFGRRMLQRENLSISTNLEISFLEKGLYIIVVKDAGGMIVGTERILKQ